MKVIGLIGGMSWESSKIYYELINTKVRETLGGSHSATCIMVSVDFARIERLSHEGKWDDIGMIMAKSAKQLEMAGADIIVLCTNTIHVVSDSILNSVDIPFLHIADATGEELKRNSIKTAGLLGTKFTMEKDFYTNLLTEKYKTDIVIPNKLERQIVHDIIYKELVRGRFSESSKNVIVKIIKKLQRAGAESVILGCTELPLLVRDTDVDIPLMDTTKIHADSAVEWAIKNNAVNE